MSNVRRFVICCLGLVVAISGLALAQEAPKPGPEHKRLGFWVGNWTNEGVVKENPVMPAGPMKSTERCDWFEGKFAVLCHTEGSGPMGPTKGIGIMSYSNEAKAYTWYGVDSSGMAMTTIPLGKVEGKTWVYNDESKMGDQTIKSRYTVEETSDSSYTFKWEMLGPDGQWMTVMEGKGKRG